MSKRVLITCPPMLAEVGQINELATEFGLELETAQVVQTLTEERLIELLPAFDGWIAGDDPGTQRALESGHRGRLRAVVKWGIGIDNIDTTAIKRMGLSFTNTPGMFSNEVADLVMGYLIALTRKFIVIDAAVRKGNWIKPQGMSLRNKTAGVIGLGNIGQAVIARLSTSGVKVIGYDPFVEDLSGVEVKHWPQRIEACDFLILCCALTPTNTHMLNHDVMARTKKGAYIINVSRGGLIDELALVQALQSGQIGAAALDVFQSEPLAVDSQLTSMSQVLLGSHNASNTLEAVRATNRKAVEAISEMLVD